MSYRCIYPILLAHQKGKTFTMDAIKGSEYFRLDVAGSPVVMRGDYAQAICRDLTCAGYARVKTHRDKPQTTHRTK